MLGAIIGDIVGSRFEFNNHRSKEFTLFCDSCFFTDDSVMTLAICEALMRAKNADCLADMATDCMQEIGRPYPGAGYGGKFFNWIYSPSPKPYNSFGNGAAMRVSGCAYAAKDIKEVKRLSYEVTKVTHNHYEGIKGAEATAVGVYMALHGYSKEEIKNYIEFNYYKLDFTLDGIRKTYKFNETCQDTVPQAFVAFLEAADFEDAIRNAISIGGDSDTLAAITGSLAEAYFGIPSAMRTKVIAYLDENLRDILLRFEAKYPAKII